MQMQRKTKLMSIQTTMDHFRDALLTFTHFALGSEKSVAIIDLITFFP